MTSSPIGARAMILAAGRGERMRPLTDRTPKPLLAVRGKPLMQWPLEALARGGFTEVVVNTAWLGEQIAQRFGARFAERDGAGGVDGAGAGVSLAYSHEGRDFGGALETAGGIVRALPQLADIFWVAAGDVYAPQFVFSQAAFDDFAASGMLAHLWLVPNPAHNPQGDFGLSAEGLALDTVDDSPRAADAPAARRYTFSTIGLYRAALFAAPWCAIAHGNPQGAHAALAPLLRAAMRERRVSAALYRGDWTDVGTPQRLAALNGG